MTQMRRPAKQQRVTLVRVFLVLAGILSITVLLFQIDAFPKRRHSVKEPFLLNPQTTLPVRESLRQQQQQLLPSTKYTTALEVIPREKGSRRYAFQVAGLKSGSSSTTTATIVIETRPSWAPIGVEHFHKLVENEFYDQCRFFRVVDDFMVQFGIAATPAQQKKWKADVLQDDPMGVQTNARGTITYATSGKDTRTTQLFINTRKQGNARLDRQGFAPIGLVTSGMDVVDEIQNKYGERPGQGKIVNRGNEYLQDEFPDLSYIVTVREIKDEQAVESM